MPCYLTDLSRDEVYDGVVPDKPIPRGFAMQITSLRNRDWHGCKLFYIVMVACADGSYSWQIESIPYTPEWQMPDNWTAIDLDISLPIIHKSIQYQIT